MNVVEPGDTGDSSGVFKVEFIKVNHSIAGACALAIHTPVGVVVHSGDFKVDYTPVDGAAHRPGPVCGTGAARAYCFCCAESTNVERPGYTMSERTVGETFNESVSKRRTGASSWPCSPATFTGFSLVVDAARAAIGRKVCLVGRSMVNVAKVAMQLGDLKIPAGRIWSAAEDIDRLS